jgi:beta-N-acetylhexosaminidase
MDDPTAGMTLEQQIGQLFVVGFAGQTASPELLDLLQREQVGGVILFSRNIRDQAQTAALTHALQSAARTAGHLAPLLVMTDQENGLVRRLGPDSTVFPGAMALGAIDGADAEELVYEIARATARELGAHGVNMNLAPVVDVNNTPANPVIGVRSFGADAERVGRLGAATVRGMQDTGIIATLKHFPGHGDTRVDSHLALPTVSAPRERLEAVELAPFRQGIAAGAASVMTAHVAYPVAYPALSGGDATPATLAPEIVSGLLRARLGFDGVVISDCLEMDAIAKTVGVEQGAVLALAAGVDLVLVSHTLQRQRASVAAVRAAVAGGALSAARVRAAAGRVLRLKRRSLAWRATPPAPLDTEVLQAHREVSAQAYARAVTVIRDSGGLTPLRLRPEQELLVLDCPPGAMTVAIDAPYSTRGLLDALRRRHARVRARTLTAAPGALAEAVQAAQAAEVTLLLTLNAHRDAQQLGLLRRVALSGRAVIGLALGNPYDAASLPDVGTYLATYEYSPPAGEAAAGVLFGQTQPRGRLPVIMPNSMSDLA